MVKIKKDLSTLQKNNNYGNHREQSDYTIGVCTSASEVARSSSSSPDCHPPTSLWSTGET